METDFIGAYRLYSDLDSDQIPVIGSDIDNTSTENANGCSTLNSSMCFPQLKYVIASLQATVLCGIMFGLCATFLWWIDLNITPSCFGGWYEIPSMMHRFALISDVVRIIIIAFWPLLIIAPICSWSMIKESSLLSLCIIAGLVDVIDRLFLYIFAHFEAHWKSYVGSCIFTLLVLVVLYKFVKYRQKHSTNNDNTIIVTLKLAAQLLFGIAMYLPYHYVFLKYYQDSTPIVRTLLSCLIIAVFYVPKLIINNLLINLHGIYRPNESIVFASVFLVHTTMLTRLTQAKIESLTFFIIVSLVHGIFNVIDKLFLSLRDKICKCVFRRGNSCLSDNLLYAQQYNAHLSLIGIVTETTSVVMSNAAAYILVYYYKTKESTGERYNGWVLFKEMVIRSGMAVCIEWIFNIVALKIQSDWYNIPVLQLWKREWKFLLVILVIQVIYFVVFSAHDVDAMLLNTFVRNSTEHCVGLFKKL